VYYLHDSLGKVVYIGKSKNIKKRVLSHFSNKRGKRYVDLRNAIADVSFEVTGSELIALLLESEEIKNRRPFYNRKQKRVFLNHHLLATVNKAGYLNLKISRQPGDEQSICTVNSYEEGEAIIDKLLLRYGLCRKFCGADDIKNACFGYSVKQCRGACLGLESPEDYNERAEQAIASLQFGEKNFFIFGRGRQENEKSVIQVERGVYMGYGYFDPDLTAPRPECLADCIKSRNDNRDIRQILSGHLKRIPADDLLRY
jgi:DNA polymerase-3 subunit epsilon